jgi:sortase A
MPRSSRSQITDEVLTRPRSADRLARWLIQGGWRTIVGGIGKVLISVGLLMFGFVGYQLWGTGIETELAQRRLEDDFERMLVEAEPTSPTTLFGEATRAAGSMSATPGESSGEGTERAVVPSNTSPLPTGEPIANGPVDTPVSSAPAGGVLPISEQRIPELDNGSALAKLEIPAIGVDHVVVAGIGVGDLKKGPGHFPDTPLPGQLGNSAIAGHRTTYGAPFFDVDQLETGDEMIVTTLTGRYVYKVERQQIVSPSDYEVVATLDPSRALLTLVSCEPKWTARERIVITGVLDEQRSGPGGEPLLNYGRGPDPSAAEAPPVATGVADQSGTDAATTPEPFDDPETETVVGVSETSTGSSAAGGITGSPAAAAPAVSPFDVGESVVDGSGLADAFGQGWFSDPPANAQVAMWGSVLAAIALAAWLVTKRNGRNLVGALVGIGPFVITLYFFYQNVNRLLPPSL